MENFPTIQKYLENGQFALIGTIAVSLVLLYLFRRPLQAFLSSFLGYRSNLDDYAFSVHRNRDTIYQNEKVNLSVGLFDKLNTLILFLSFVSLLISPYLFIALIALYQFKVIKEKINQLVDYNIYEELKTDDEFVKFFNQKSAKIDLIINQILFTSYVFIAVGLIFENGFIASTGLIPIAVISLLSITLLYNASMYRINYKNIEYYRILRLLSTSSLSSSRSLYLLALLSFASNYTDLQGFSVYIWSIFIIRATVGFVLNKFLKKEDDITKKHQLIENRNYTDIATVASYPNPISQSRGYKFTTALQMKIFELEKNDTSIHVDNYAFYPQTVNRTDLRKNPLLLNTIKESVKVKFETLDFTKQILVLGGMGSGKTELINYTIQQVHENNFSNFKAIAYNDIKGDFTKDFYREDKDILVNLYDSRASVWCPFLEMNSNIEAGTAFINNLFETIQGSEKDFFSASAKQKTSIWLQESFFATDDNIEAWELFFSKIQAYEDQIKETDDKTQSSILATINIALEILKIMHYQIVIEKRKTFTFNDFVNAENIQLFFVNNKQYEAKLTPYLNGLTATYINTIMAKDDTKTHLILNIFDEFLTMKIDEATRKTLLTATRSKGFCNLLASQYLVNDEKLIQDLDSSRYALITFNVNDDFTLSKVASKLAEQEYLSANSSESQEQNSKAQFGNGGNAGELDGGVFSILGSFIPGMKKNNISNSIAMTKVVLEQQLQSMPKYHHLTFIPSEETTVLSGIDAKRYFKLMLFGYEKLMKNIVNKNDFLAKESGILYLGYTPQATLKFNNKSFEKWDMAEFYKASASTPAEPAPFKDEKEEFIHYMNIKFAETVENSSKYMTEHNLDKSAIQKMFQNVEENNEKVILLMANYSEQERYELMEQFFDIRKDDLSAKYEFCKKHDLIGAILGIFTFSKEFQEKTLNAK